MRIYFISINSTALKWERCHRDGLEKNQNFFQNVEHTKSLTKKMKNAAIELNFQEQKYVQRFFESCEKINNYLDTEKRKKKSKNYKQFMEFWKRVVKIERLRKRERFKYTNIHLRIFKAIKKKNLHVFF